MIKYSTAGPAHPIGGSDKGEQMSKNVSSVNHVSLRACKNRRGQGHDQEPKEDPNSVAACSHQRRWSADLSQCGSAHVIVRKNKKEPQPPQRGISLLKPNTAKHPSVISHSQPPLRTSGYPSRPYSSSSSSVTSSPSHVQTSVITGHDPLGWKLHPSSCGTLTHRLSLQIPPPVISPEPKRRPAPYCQSDNASDPDLLCKTKTPLRPKPPRRHHSDSSAFLRSLATPLPVVTADELCAVHLRSITLSDMCDDVYCRGNEEQVRVTTQPGQRPPPVPEKTSTAREIACLIAHSHKPCRTTKEHIYIGNEKSIPKHSHPTEAQSSVHGKGTAGWPVDTNYDRKRSNPRFTD